MTAIMETKPTMNTTIRKGAIGTVIAVVVNAALFLIGSTFTFPAEALSPLGEPVTLGPVIIMTLLAGVVATIGYLVLTRFLTLRNANIVMWVVTVLVLIGMVYGPFGIENVPLAEIVILEIMHLVAAIPVYWLTR